MSDNDWLFDEEQAARIRRLVTPDETGSQDVPGPTTVRRLLDALNAAEARAEASEREVERYREALEQIVAVDPSCNFWSTEVALAALVGTTTAGTSKASAREADERSTELDRVKAFANLLIRTMQARGLTVDDAVAVNADTPERDTASTEAGGA